MRKTGIKFFAAQFEHYQLVCLALGAALLFVFWLHLYENRKLKERLVEQGMNATAPWMLRFAWARSLQLLGIMLVCFVLIGIYDYRLTNTEKERDHLTEENASNADEIVLLKATPPCAVPVATAPKPAATKPAPVAAAVPNSINDLYGVNKNPLDMSATIDSMKVRYEDILITYQFLKKCNRTNAPDYALIISALQREIKSLHAASRLQYDIITAAKGSYQEIYSKNNCEPNMVETLSTQYSNYIDSLKRIAEKR